MKATLWNDLHPDYLRPGLGVFDTPAIGGGGNKYFSCGGGEVEELDETARRIIALWNAAEELGLTTEAIREGAIQRTFMLAESRAGTIGTALERIEKLEEEKTAVIQVLGDVLSGYYEWSGCREEIDPIMVRAQRFLDTIEKAEENKSNTVFVHIEKFEEATAVLKEVVLLYSCGVIGVLPNGITAPDGSDEGIVKGTLIVEKLMADVEAVIEEEGMNHD